MVVSIVVIISSPPEAFASGKMRLAEPVRYIKTFCPEMDCARALGSSEATTWQWAPKREAGLSIRGKTHARSRGVQACQIDPLLLPIRAVARRSTQEPENNFSVLMFLAGTGLCYLTSA